MRVAIISDIHSNLEAFRQVLTDAHRSAVDRLVCLGDNIGYGPEPEEVVNLIRDQGIPCILGNHELAIIEPKYQQLMNPNARESLLLTQKLISPQTLNYIKGLKASLVFQGSLCVHGCPPNSVITYLFQVSMAKLKEIFLSTKEKTCFVGHTHNLEIIRFDGKEIARSPLSKGIHPLEAKQRYIINVGSVGQPRDGDNKLEGPDGMTVS